MVMSAGRRGGAARSEVDAGVDMSEYSLARFRAPATNTKQTGHGGPLPRDYGERPLALHVRADHGELARRTAEAARRLGRRAPRPDRVRRATSASFRRG